MDHWNWYENILFLQQALKQAKNGHKYNMINQHTTQPLHKKMPLMIKTKFELWLINVSKILYNINK